MVATQPRVTGAIIAAAFATAGVAVTAHRAAPPALPEPEFSCVMPDVTLVADHVVEYEPPPPVPTCHSRDWNAIARVLAGECWDADPYLLPACDLLDEQFARCTADLRQLGPRALTVTTHLGALHANAIVERTPAGWRVSRIDLGNVK
jgi:hypothetical protein